jgi:serine/threonine protein kinase
MLRGLVAALVHLRTGSTHERKVRPVAGWRPILHRNIKPDNVFVGQAAAVPLTSTGLHVHTPSARRRSTDRCNSPPMAAAAYPAVALGDFSHAMYAKTAAKDAQMYSTPILRRAPEVPQQDLRGRTDVWFVGAVAKFVANLCPEYRTGRNDNYNDAHPAGSSYSHRLNLTIATAMEPNVNARYEAGRLFEFINNLYDQAQLPLEPLLTQCCRCK